MFRLPSRARPLAAFFVALVPCLLTPSSALSNPAPLAAPPPVIPLATRIATIENRMLALELRLRAFEKVGLTSMRDGSFALTANGARVNIAPNGSVTVAPGAGSRASFPPPDPCDPPFSVDPQGIRRFKMECAELTR